MEKEAAKTESLIDQLTVSDDFNIGLTGDQIFSEHHISPQKPTQTEWFRVYGTSLNDIKKAFFVKSKSDLKMKIL